MKLLAVDEYFDQKFSDKYAKYDPVERCQNWPYRRHHRLTSLGVPYCDICRMPLNPEDTRLDEDLNVSSAVDVLARHFGFWQCESFLSEHLLRCEFPSQALLHLIPEFGSTRVFGGTKSSALQSLF